MATTTPQREQEKHYVWHATHEGSRCAVTPEKAARLRSYGERVSTVSKEEWETVASEGTTDN